MNLNTILKTVFKKIEQFTVIAQALIIVVTFLYYFEWLSEDVLNDLLPLQNREFGIVEGLQHVALLIGFLIMLIATIKCTSHKAIYTALTCFILFVFLEEIDYFMHYFDWFLNRSGNGSNTSNFRNLHNQLQVARKVSYLVVIYCSVLLLIFKGSKIFSNPVLKTTIISMFVFIQLVFPLLLWFFNIYEDSRQVYSELRELCFYITVLCVIIRTTHSH